jgi:hypothetical protein
MKTKNFHSNLLNHLRNTKVENFEFYDREYYQKFDDNKLKRFIFDNYRIMDDTEKGLRLCYAGFDILKEYYDYREVTLTNPKKENILTSGFLLELDNIMKMPYLIKGNTLVLFDLQMAFEAGLFIDFLSYVDSFFKKKKTY